MKLFSPAAVRNVGVIGDVLDRWLPASGMVLEIASGSGQHVAAFATRFPHLTWQPTEAVEQNVTSIAAHVVESGASNILPPRLLDVTEPDWRVDGAAAVVNINMIHASPWQTCVGLMAGAGRILSAGAVLYLYGPFIEEERSTAPSNSAFDRDLRSRDERWGIRRLIDVCAEATSNGLDLVHRHEMPANNLSLVFRRR